MEAEHCGRRSRERGLHQLRTWRVLVSRPFTCIGSNIWLAKFGEVLLLCFLKFDFLKYCSEHHPSCSTSASQSGLFLNDKDPLGLPTAHPHPISPQSAPTPSPFLAASPTDLASDSRYARRLLDDPRLLEHLCTYQEWWRLGGIRSTGAPALHNGGLGGFTGAREKDAAFGRF